MKMTESAVTVTLKAGAGYDAPWVVVRADTPAEATQYLTALGNQGVFAVAAEVAAEFAGVFNTKKGLGGTPIAVEPAPTGWGNIAPAAPVANQTFQQAAAPQGYAPSAPAQAGAPLDQFGKAMKYVESKPGAAKQWKAWMGDYSRDDPKDKQVSPQWIR
jgi:hypothetical protein